MPEIWPYARTIYKNTLVTSDKMHEQNKQNGHLALGIKRFIPADI